MSAEPLSASDLVNFASGAITAVGGLVQLMSEIAADRQRIRYAESAVGSLGKWFRRSWTSPLRFAHALLFLVTSLAALGLIGRANWLGGSVEKAAASLFTHSPALLLAYVALALAVHLRLPGKLWFCVGQIKSRYSRPTAFDPGLINAEWLFLRGTADPVLVNVDRIRCEMVASFLFRIPPEKTAVDRSDNSTPAISWPAANRANALLFACVIEGAIHELTDGKKRNLAELFTAFTTADPATWSPASISPASTACAIAECLKTTTTMADLADEQVVLTLVQQTAALLRDEYNGSAASLAGGRVSWMSGNAIEHVLGNLRRFPALDGIQRPGRDLQFLKLALEAGVWPDMKSDFIYPYSTDIAKFLLNTGCLVCTPGTEKLVVDPLLMRIVAAAEEIIVESTEEILRRRPDLHIHLRLPLKPSRWQVARAVDYTVWWLSRQPSGWRLRTDALELEVAKDPPSPRWSASCKTLSVG